MKNIILYGEFGTEVHNIFREMLPDNFRIYKSTNKEQISEFSEADYMINRTYSVDAGILDNCKKLRYIQKWGAGYDKIDIAAAGLRGIPVVACLGVNANPVAELTVLHMLALYRNILPLNEKLKGGIWARDDYSKTAYMIYDKLIGLIGVGSIGRKVAEIAGKGFGAKLQYYDLKKMTIEEEISLGIKYTDIDTLMRTSDIISLHLPLTSSTQNIIDKENLSKMKPTSIIINTSRGGIIDEEALIDALKNKIIAGAGLDTFSNEPLDALSPLLEFENVVATPHCGGNTADNNYNMVNCCVQDILAFEKGEIPTPPQLVNHMYLKSS